MTRGERVLQVAFLIATPVIFFVATSAIVWPFQWLRANGYGPVSWLLLSAAFVAVLTAFERWRYRARR